jgi:methionine sulfoxide reductase heme-binding subunit
MMMAPWLDRTGRFSPLKAAVLLSLCIPTAWLLVQAEAGWLGARPVTEAIHQAGLWAVRFLVLSLTVTPLRRVTGWSRLILVRRMIGLAALAYAVLHLTLFAADQAFDLGRVVVEIALRFYLLVGFAALLVLAALGATSFDRAIRAMGGKRWQALHRLVYPAAVVAVVHFFLQTKADVSEPVLMAGLLLWLLAFRLLDRGPARIGSARLAALAVGTALVTALGEAAWYALATGIDPVRVLGADFSLMAGIRPVWWVLAAGSSAVVLRLATDSGAKPRRLAPIARPAVGAAVS